MEGAEERGWGRGEGGNDEIRSVDKTNRGEEKGEENGYPKKVPEETNTKQILCTKEFWVFPVQTCSWRQDTTPAGPQKTVHV